jgi:hypothetical protein
MALEEPIAREHIRDTMARYNIAGDQRDLAAFLATFTEDALYESAIFRCQGKPAIRAYLSAFWSSSPAKASPRFRRHNLTTCQIDLTAAIAATSRAYYLVISDIGPDHSGYYLDHWCAEQGRWLISRRQVWMDWCRSESLCVPEVSKRLLAETGACGPCGSGPLAAAADKGT